jgi:hypothetical protein
LHWGNRAKFDVSAFLGQNAEVKLTPHCCSSLGQSKFAEWGLKSECSSWGTPSEK